MLSVSEVKLIIQEARCGSELSRRTGVNYFQVVRPWLLAQADDALSEEAFRLAAEISARAQDGGSPPNQRSANLDTRLDDIEARYKAGETLQVIGDAYGVTRERIRQLLKKRGIVGKDGGLRITTAIRRAAKFTVKPPPKGNLFVALVREWLTDVGYGYCCMCCLPVPLSLMGKSKPGRNPPRCRKCLADARREWYKNPENKAIQTAYNKKNPESTRRAVRKYNERNREKITEKRRHRYNTDPAFREYVLEKCRAYQARKKAAAKLEQSA